MLKLIIADDERIIRESISTLIDWGSLGIELAGVCSDGIEAYNMILDECPDIVLTDIRMPGLSGLDLIERISQTDLSIQFVLLSGYGEFEYAKQAMRFRVHHYLLKPCNEEQIIESMKDVIQEHYHHRAFQDMKNRQRLLVSNLHHNLLSNIIHEGTFLSDHRAVPMDAYAGFMDFYNTSYELCFLHFLEESCLMETLEKVYAYMKREAPGIAVYSIYVKNNLLLFFESYHVSYDQMDSFFRTMAGQIGETNKVAPEYRRVSFSNLASLLETVISKVKRFGMIYFMNGLRAVPICNYKTVITRLEELLAESMEDPYKVDWQSGETETDSKGKPARRPTKTEAFMMPDGSLYERHYYVPLPEEVEELRRLIGLARPAWQDEEVMNIIREETAAYFHGQKSLETVTGLIDNRVGLYMNER